MKTIPVLFEDEWLFAVDKPAGLLTIPTPRNEIRTLTNIVNEELEKGGVTYRLYPCHRLDRETSGIVLFAKGKAIQQKMMDEFKRRQVHKRYIAFVHGIPRHDSGSLRGAIAGESAQTDYRVIEKRKSFSIVEARPLTGRTNQIRIHFKNLGHPIVGEDKFAFRKDFALRCNRLCLHAISLEFTHPFTHKPVRIETELPRAMKEFTQ